MSLVSCSRQTGGWSSGARTHVDPVTPSPDVHFAEGNLRDGKGVGWRKRSVSSCVSGAALFIMITIIGIVKQDMKLVPQKWYHTCKVGWHIYTTPSGRWETKNRFCEAVAHRYKTFLDLINSMELNPSWEAECHTAAPEFPYILRNPKFITMFLSWARWIQSIPPHPNSLRTILILFSLSLGVVF
jgi:hypothetical protein